MFERYTEKARRVIFFARYEASQFGSPYIETEHLLLGILREDHGLFRELNLPKNAREVFRKRIESSVTRGAKVSTSLDLPLSAMSKRVLAHGAEESERLNDPHIGPAHLLLGLIRERTSLAAEVLASHAITLDQVRLAQLKRQTPHAVEELQKAGLSEDEVSRIVESAGRARLKREEAEPRQHEVPTAEAAMIRLISGFWISRAIYMAARLALADLLSDGAKSIEELAAATGSEPRALYRMLRALANINIFREVEPHRFATTPLAQTLLSDRPGTLRYLAMTELGQEHYSAWEDFDHSIRTGGRAFDHKFNQSVWDYYAGHPEDARIFSNAIGGLNEWINHQILRAHDFSPFRNIVDMGGGDGAFLAAVLDLVPDARGVLFDKPPVIAGATRLLKAGLAGRSEQIAGDFYQSAPPGGDVYLLKWILQECSDEECFGILSHIRGAMAPGARVLIIEPVLGYGPDRVFKYFFDLNYLVMTGCRIRSKEEFRGLLARAGLAMTRIIPTQSPVGIVEAIAQSSLHY